jgi:hypothetical protein
VAEFDGCEDFGVGAEREECFGGAQGAEVQFQFDSFRACVGALACAGGGAGRRWGGEVRGVDAQELGADLPADTDPDGNEGRDVVSSPAG